MTDRCFNYVATDGSTMHSGICTQKPRILNGRYIFEARMYILRVKVES